MWRSHLYTSLRPALLLQVVRSSEAAALGGPQFEQFLWKCFAWENQLCLSPSSKPKQQHWRLQLRCYMHVFKKLPPQPRHLSPAQLVFLTAASNQTIGSRRQGNGQNNLRCKCCPTIANFTQLCTCAWMHLYMRTKRPSSINNSSICERYIVQMSRMLQMISCKIEMIVPKHYIKILSKYAANKRFKVQRVPRPIKVPRFKSHRKMRTVDRIEEDIGPNAMSVFFGNIYFRLF